jgi:hypothetical protein
VRIHSRTDFVQTRLDVIPLHRYQIPVHWYQLGPGKIQARGWHGPCAHPSRALLPAFDRLSGLWQCRPGSLFCQFRVSVRHARGADLWGLGPHRGRGDTFLRAKRRKMRLRGLYCTGAKFPAIRTAGRQGGPKKQLDCDTKRRHEQRQALITHCFAFGL